MKFHHQQQLLLLLLFLSSSVAARTALEEVASVLTGVADREEELREALGPYRIYIYEGPAFDEMTTRLLSHANKRHLEFNEYRAAIWVHRALLHDPSRTMDPSEADIFFVPGYLQLSADLSNTNGRGRGVTRPENEARLARWRAAVHDSKWFQRHGGADHLFSLGDCNPGWAVEHGIRFAVSAPLSLYPLFMLPFHCCSLTIVAALL